MDRKSLFKIILQLAQIQGCWDTGIMGFGKGQRIGSYIHTYIYVKLQTTVRIVWVCAIAVKAPTTHMGILGFKSQFCS